MSRERELLAALERLHAAAVMVPSPMGEEHREAYWALQQALIQADQALSPQPLEQPACAVHRMEWGHPDHKRDEGCQYVTVATSAALDVERLARALHDQSCQCGDLDLGLAAHYEEAVAIAAAYRAAGERA